MEATHIERLRQAFSAYADRCRGQFPVTAALAEGLGALSPAVVELFGRFYRILSATVPNVPLLIAGLHHLALRGDQPELAALLPTCGGAFTADNRERLIEAAEGALAESREELLDFMLSYTPVRYEVRRSAALLLGALATASRFGGGLSVVEIGAGGGLHLGFDRYRYRFGQIGLGDSPVAVDLQVQGGGEALDMLLSQGMPKVIDRVGLDPEPPDLTDPDQALIPLAFLLPDQVASAALYREAVAELAREGVPAVRQGTPEDDLAALLVERYNQMEQGHTLLLFQTQVWPFQADWQRQRTASAVQLLAAQIQPHKPVAWLQAEPFNPGSANLELRLHTFDWTDPEAREVLKLGEAAPDLAWVRWG